jgi:hypothetical protein
MWLVPLKTAFFRAVLHTLDWYWRAYVKRHVNKITTLEMAGTSGPLVTSARFNGVRNIPHRSVAAQVVYAIPNHAAVVSKKNEVKQRLKLLYRITPRNKKETTRPKARLISLSTDVIFGALQNAYCVHEVATGKLVSVFPILSVFV